MENTQIDMFDCLNNDGDIEIPYSEILVNNYGDKIFFLENGKMYTVFYDTNEWVESWYAEMVNQNAKFRAKYLTPRGVNLSFGAMLMRKARQVNIDSPNIISKEFFNITEYFTGDYKKLYDKVSDIIQFHINCSNEMTEIPMVIMVLDVHDIRQLNVLKSIAEKFDIPVVAGMKMSYKVLETVDLSIYYSVPITEVLDTCLWFNDPVFKKMENAILVSNNIFIQVGDKNVVLPY